VGTKVVCVWRVLPLWRDWTTPFRVSSFTRPGNNIQQLTHAFPFLSAREKLAAG
jgi:hypothetical protein